MPTSDESADDTDPSGDEEDETTDQVPVEDAAGPRMSIDEVAPVGRRELATYGDGGSGDGRPEVIVEAEPEPDASVEEADEDLRRRSTRRTTSPASARRGRRRRGDRRPRGRDGGVPAGPPQPAR
jgi:hypothetical protein